MTINQAFEILADAANTKDAKIILRNLLNLPDNSPFFPDNKKLPFLTCFRVKQAAKKLMFGTPIAKIIGKKWFYGLEFSTSNNTLDPRPDTEILVETALSFAPKRVLDIGTGTGAVICAIAKNSNAHGIGIDVSASARRIARRNVKRLELQNRVQIKRGNFNSTFHTPHSTFDIIVSNPPYIPYGDMRVNSGAKFDPSLALYGGTDGLDAYRAIAKNFKAPIIVLEIGLGQGDKVREIFAAAGWRFLYSKNDLSGIERVLVFMI